jgi:hypothetical protein
VGRVVAEIEVGGVEERRLRHGCRAPRNRAERGGVRGFALGFWHRRGGGTGGRSGILEWKVTRVRTESGDGG